MIDLTCDQAAPMTVSTSALLNGATTLTGKLHLNSTGWGGSATLPTKTVAAPNGNLAELVTDVLVDWSAAPTTTVSVESPADAQLFFTDAATWGADGSALTAQQILAGSARSVTLQSCGKTGHEIGYHGMLLVPHAECVTLRFQGHGHDNDGGSDRTDELAVPVGVTLPNDTMVPTCP
jgi:hypothetical protein